MLRLTSSSSWKCHAHGLYLRKNKQLKNTPLLTTKVKVFLCIRTRIEEREKKKDLEDISLIAIKYFTHDSHIKWVNNECTECCKTQPASRNFLKEREKFQQGESCVLYSTLRIWDLERRFCKFEAKMKKKILDQDRFIAF